MSVDPASPDYLGRSARARAMRRGPVEKPRRRQAPKQTVSEREGYLRRKYGIGVDQFDELYHRQAYACSICSHRIRVGLNLAVDHDHDTGAVRGLLCSNCNAGIGMLKDDPDVLRAAAEYLDRMKGSVTGAVEARYR